MVSWSKFLTEKSQLLVAMLQNVVVPVTWGPEFVHLSYQWCIYSHLQKDVYSYLHYT